MKKSYKALIWLLAVLLVFSLGTPAVLAENEDEPEQTVEPTAEPEPTEEPTAAPTTAPTVAPTQAPTKQPTAAPTKAPTQAPTTAPTAEPTQAPTVAPTQTQAQAQSAGTVDLTFVCHDNGELAAGYTFRLGSTDKETDSSGWVTFSGVSVETYSVKLISPDGNESSGTIHMSRGGSTVMTNQAMGGTYGVTLAQSASKVYMDANFNSGAAIGLSGITEAAPAKAEGEPEDGDDETSDDAVKVVAEFLDEDGKAVSGMTVSIKIDTGSGQDETDSKGKLTVDGFPLGTSEWSFEEFDPFTLTMRKGIQTTLVGAGGGDYSVSVSPDAKQVNLKFEQDGTGFVLREVTEGAGGMSAGIVVLIIVIVAVVVIVVIAVVKKKKGTPGTPKGKGKPKSTVAPPGRTQREQKKQGTQEPEKPRTTQGPRQTGGANKFGDRSRM